MSKITHATIRVKSAAHFVSNFAVRNVMKTFAQKHGLVYFGRVNARDDDYGVVRGITASTTHRDLHFTVGTTNGRDVVIFERQNILSLPSHRPKQFRWLISQIDIKEETLPHVFVIYNRHESVYFTNIMAIQQTAKDLTDYFASNTQLSTPKYRIYASPSDYEALSKMLSPHVIQFFEKYTGYDYEINDDCLLVYATEPVVTPQILNNMLSVGMLLADILEQ
jgi:hypothetical protein